MTETYIADQPIASAPIRKIKTSRIESIDLLRGVIMIIMVLDHTRDYFHRDAFLYDPSDLNHTNTLLFFTRWITHFCAPIFVFLAGVSAYLYGTKKTKKQLAFFLLTRGMWLVFTELFILSLFRTFDPTYHFFNLQVIWAIGISMVALSGMIFLSPRLIFFAGLVLIAAHNLLDNIHVPGNNASAFLWALLHQTGYFTFGNITFHVHYPLLPWIGIICIGYCFGKLYVFGFDAAKRKKILLLSGICALYLFLFLRLGNFYGDPSPWSAQKNIGFSFLSFLNVTKYPPSLLYILITLAPACIFLALAEEKLKSFSKKITMLGRVPMFFYLAHILLIHILATIGAVITGYGWSAMVLHTMVNRAPALKDYGFNLWFVYSVWALVILILYPVCKWFDHYKRKYHSSQWWLSYL